MFPNWDSLDSVRNAHSVLEGGALIFFAFLVIFDVLAHLYDEAKHDRAKLFERLGLVCFTVAVLADIVAYPYSGRNDLLSAQRDATQMERIAVLENSTQALRSDADIARKQAEDEATARVRIEASVAWRRITKQQQAEIGSSLARRFSNQGVSVWYNEGDIEGSSFAADIAQALQAAHTLRVYLPSGILVFEESGRRGEPIKRLETGVSVQSTNDYRSRALAAAIISELTARGFDAGRPSDPPFDPNPIPQVWVTVEPRPQGPQGEFKLATQHAVTKK